MPIQSVQAIILRKDDFRDTSFLLNCYTDRLGKIKGIIKGVKGYPFKYGSPLEIMTLNALVVYERHRSDLGLIGQVDLMDDFGGVRRDPKKTAFGAYFVEIVDRFTAFGDPHPDIFHLLRNALRALRETQRYVFLTHVFEVRLLKSLGILPHVNRCGGCMGYDVEPVTFDVAKGNVYCHTCSSPVYNGIATTRHACSGIQAITDGAMEGDFSVALLERLYERSGENRDAVRMIRRFIDYHLDFPLKSIPVIRQFYREGVET
ncbi:MAG: DNA repair protein RecO [Candidatus Omnitrophica bacterium]|nr:DNA repair protein RecO [Candidatus Omnitrophota bacterium]